MQGRPGQWRAGLGAMTHMGGPLVATVTAGQRSACRLARARGRLQARAGGRPQGRAGLGQTAGAGLQCVVTLVAAGSRQLSRRCSAVQCSGGAGLLSPALSAVPRGGPYKAPGVTVIAAVTVRVQ